MWLHMTCLQSRVAMSPGTRARIVERHDTLVAQGELCPFCDVEELE